MTLLLETKSIVKLERFIDPLDSRLLKYPKKHILSENNELDLETN